MTISRMAGGTPLACAAFDRPLGSDLKPIGVYRIAERMFDTPAPATDRQARAIEHSGWQANKLSRK